LHEEQVVIKKAINRWAFASALGVGECLQMAKKHGFDGLELNLEEKGDFSLGTSREELRRIKKLAEQAGVEICSICSLLFWKYPITSGDPKIRDKGIEVVRAMIDSASELGVGIILVVPGMVHADPPLDFGNAPIRYVDAYNRALSITRELAEHAGKQGVIIGLENVYYNKFLITQMEYKRFLEELASNSVKLYLDVGNTMLCGFPEDWIEYLAGHICQFHIKDFDKNINTLYGWRNIFQGHVNWDKVASAIKAIGYQGYLVGEPALSPYLHQQEELVKTTSSALERLREMIHAG
jgi:L-ribulose-5-phosphate 3-epimerase